MNKRKVFINLGFVGIFLCVVLTIYIFKSYTKYNKCPGYYQTKIVELPLFDGQKLYFCEKADPALYEGSEIVQIEDRKFDIPLGYMGRHKPPPHMRENFNDDFVVINRAIAIYPHFEPGFPYFVESTAHRFGDEKIVIRFRQVRKTDSISDEVIDIESFIKNKELDGTKRQSLEGFEGYKLNGLVWYYNRNEDNEIENTLTCHNNHFPVEKRHCELEFINKKQSLKYTVSFSMVLVKHWEDIKTKSSDLVGSFEVIEN